MVPVLNSVDILDTSNQIWYHAPPMPHRGNTFKMLVAEDYLYVLIIGQNDFNISKITMRVHLPTLISRKQTQKHFRILTYGKACQTFLTLHRHFLQSVTRCFQQEGEETGFLVRQLKQAYNAIREVPQHVN